MCLGKRGRVEGRVWEYSFFLCRCKVRGSREKWCYGAVRWAGPLEGEAG